MPGTYDPQTNAVWWGVANPDPLYDWAGSDWMKTGARPGTNLYTSSVIALARVGEGPEPSEDTWTSVLGPIGVLDLTSDATLMHAVIDDVRVFAGYAGWETQQLRNEIAEGAWFVVDALPSDATTDDPDTLWREVLRRQPDNTRIFANYPPDPAVN